MEDSKTPSTQKTIIIDDAKYKTEVTKKYLMRKPYTPRDPKKLISFIPGTILKLYVKPGDNVKKGDKLLVLEAMKMRNEILAPVEGTIKKIHVETGKTVPKNTLLLEFE